MKKETREILITVAMWLIIEVIFAIVFILVLWPEMLLPYIPWL